jgi:hypothetical protein
VNAGIASVMFWTESNDWSQRSFTAKPPNMMYLGVFGPHVEVPAKYAAEVRNT